MPSTLIPSRTRLLAVVLLVALTLSGCSRQPELVEITGRTMGTSYSVKLVDLPPGLSPAALQAEIDAHLEHVNGLMSTYRPDSDLSRFNASPSTEWFPTSAELVELVTLARSISVASAGAFDITVGPLVNLWGFGPDAHPFSVPDAHLIEETRRRVGYEKLAVRADPSALRKERPDLYVDLSAIAKGYGVDQVAALLDQRGVDAYLVEIGGELKAKGFKPGGAPWRIAVERPDAAARAVYRVVPLRDAAMATSGDYRNFYEHEGRLYSHTIDPSTGHPVDHRLASVTVIAQDCATADALATALLVLGPERGFELAESRDIAAFLISRGGERHEDRATPAFERLLGEEGGAD
ncbi:MAG: FAD:protein FMN transferase [Thiocapsa sp.]|jgi:thiamine biosynthesis lipoprotein|nr:FAD:protein FMN transferase [Thiocapsa sp.]MCG6898198.1 FAD:protein FMN transferase [Thiocapsa sp.]MCG6983615.1 FAD:protein FMN transferase [Thiocapsa sp.]